MDNQNNIKQENAPTSAPIGIEVPAGMGVTVAPEPPKKKANVPAILLSILALALAGVAAFFGVEYFMNLEKPKNEKPVVSVDTISADDAAKITAATMADEYKEVEAVMEELTVGIVDGHSAISSGNELAYIPAGLNSYVPMRFDLEMSIDNVSGSEATTLALQTAFLEAGFESVGTIPFRGSAGPQILGYYNSNNDIVCGIYDGFVLACAKASWTWLTEEEKTLIGELETAYYKKTGEYPGIIYGFNNEINDSEYEPYQNLKVAIGGGYALFYRTSPESEWVYFAGGQAALECSEYDTEDLKKAFFGDPCFSSTDIETVQL